MTDVFLGFLNRSLVAAVLILAVLIIRLVFKQAPKWPRGRFRRSATGR